MKKIAFTLILLVGLLVGCDKYDTGEIVENGDWYIIGKHGKYNMLRDTETGCLYLQHKQDRTAISPYYDEYGKVSGCGEEDESSKYRGFEDD